ncbi:MULTISPECIES: hypothetical protein [unclassified Streptococcus]|uniref:hypothetical protein n=1 Tax=unclassified Streptococcus TaxID=2608887 RepID=UPI00211B5470|nr:MULTISPECIES: hypothetical protein [unclassified Streptococcus]MCQ9211644.1 hypothetical protein [Streptococcus sp. B01]MCQ9213161.1 hypothetical protein [Streptococcus sp. O1]MCQ9214949.1 hypothetical protein [Streptococcus sp. O1]MCQ9215039.1 hypothetical protein [Streptococcus sp. O1]MCQ9215083.1 hypothetical protein [Streptococcus sp. O1]
MDKVLEQLAKFLGVTVEGLQGVISSIGGNYQEIYQTLVREMTFKSVADNLGVVLIILSAAGTCYYVFMAIIYFIELNSYSPDNDILRRYKKYIINVSKIFIPIYLVLALLISLSPLLYPNLNLILELLEKTGG